MHICISDNEGKTIGGHLDNGCIVYTTAEIVGASEEFSFIRTIDAQTGYKELEIIPNPLLNLCASGIQFIYKMTKTLTRNTSMSI